MIFIPYSKYSSSAKAASISRYSVITYTHESPIYSLSRYPHAIAIRYPGIGILIVKYVYNTKSQYSSQIKKPDAKGF